MKRFKFGAKNLFKNFFWIFICVVIIFCSILFPEFYFKVSDGKKLNTVSSEDVSNINLSISNTVSMSVYEKMDIINSFYTDTNLNFDYSDEYSYSDIHDIAMDELEIFFKACTGRDIYIAGVYELVIEKHLIISKNDNSENFTVWVIDMNYYGFTLNFMLDYDTNKILALYMDFNPENNSYYSKEKLIAQDFYSYAISPVMEFLYPVDERGNSARISSASNECADIIAAYYEINELISGEISNSYMFNYTYTLNDEEHFISVNRDDYSLSINNY